MTDLTEQWKKGELPEGHYYIKTRSETNIDEYIQWYKDHGIPSEKSFAYFNVQQVLAPVPSYEEYLESESHCVVMRELYDIEKEKNEKLKERNDSLNNRDINLCRIANGIRDENFALKELLKEVKDYLPEFETPMDILAKIEEALK